MSTVYTTLIPRKNVKSVAELPIERVKNNSKKSPIRGFFNGELFLPFQVYGGVPSLLRFSIIELDTHAMHGSHLFVLIPVFFLH